MARGGGESIWTAGGSLRRMRDSELMAEPTMVCSRVGGAPDAVPPWLLGSVQGSTIVGRVRKVREELADGAIRIEPDRLRIRADERPAEQPAWPPGDIVPLQRHEQRQLDFGPVSDRVEIDALCFAPLAQSSAELFTHAPH